MKTRTLGAVGLMLAVGCSGSEGAAEWQRKGFHCLSLWDGSHSEVVRLVKEDLRDPDSFQHIETRVSVVSDQGLHSFTMEYRARNGFGGMNVGASTGVYVNADVGGVDGEAAAVKECAVLRWAKPDTEAHAYTYTPAGAAWLEHSLKSRVED